MQVSLEPSHGNAEIELLFQVLSIPVDEVVWPLIALMDERIMHVDQLDARVAFTQTCDMGIVQPQGIGGRPDVRPELAWTRHVQISHGSGQHQDVARTLKRAKDEVSHKYNRC
jgi:hypothetical protein